MRRRQSSRRIVTASIGIVQPCIRSSRPLDERSPGGLSFDLLTTPRGAVASAVPAAPLIGQCGESDPSTSLSTASASPSGRWSRARSRSGSTRISSRRCSTPLWGRATSGSRFDDGNASDVEHALPGAAPAGPDRDVLRRRRQAGRSRASSTRRTSERWPPPGWTIGCHGMRHRPWRRLDERRACARSWSTRSGCSRSRAAARDRSRLPVRLLRPPRAPLPASPWVPPRLHERSRDRTVRATGSSARNTVAAGRRGRPGRAGPRLERSPLQAWRRRAKLAVKRWR